MPMSEPAELFVLVADRDIEQTVLGLLARTHALAIRSIQSAKVRPFARHDGGCRVEGVALLRALRGQFRHSLLIFDHEGSGADTTTVELENLLQEDLCKSGWGDNAAVIVIDPEIEAWVWAESKHVDRILGWSEDGSLRSWLQSNNYIKPGQQKPVDPKAAMLAALKHKAKKPSSSIFRQLADSVSFKGCTDRSFNKLTSTLQRWFPPSE